MFHPVGHPMERGWVGRVDGDRVVHLAAQTLQSFFTGGGSAREHAEYPLSEVALLAPVLHPPAVRTFEDEASFAFANPAAIVGPQAEIRREPPGRLALCARIAAVVGGGGAIAGFTACADWRDPRSGPPKDRDFALGLGPVVVTADAVEPARLEVVVRVDGEERLRAAAPRLDWAAARDLAEAGTVLRAGDLLVGPALGPVEVAPGDAVELEVDGIGVLAERVAG